MSLYQKIFQNMIEICNRYDSRKIVIAGFLEVRKVIINVFFLFLQLFC